MHIFLYICYTTFWGDILTNINCTSNCIYQKDGKCDYELISLGKISSTSDCEYFVSKTEK